MIKITEVITTSYPCAMPCLNFGETVAMRFMRALQCGFAPDPMKFSIWTDTHRKICKLGSSHAKMNEFLQFLSFYVNLFWLN
jgi:hypothetical protein